MFKQTRKAGMLLFGLAVASGTGFFALHLASQPAHADIKQTDAKPAFSAGAVTSGRNEGKSGTLATTGKLKYESNPVTTNQPKTNVVGLMWDQQGQSQAVSPEVRIFDGSKWTAWVPLGDPEDRKDVKTSTQSGLVLTSNAQRVQYRFTLASTGQVVSVSNPKLTFIDSTKGPDPTKPTLAQRLLGTAHAANGPRIYSRAEWGCPQPNSSPAWPPEYRTLYQAVVHHTVTAGDPSNSAAEVRGIWQYHTYSNNWGDIGYNYLVDKNGSIFQGRYFDQAYAASHKVDVVGGHAYGHNYGTTGIANLGDFTWQQPTNAELNSVGNIAAFKLAPYNVNPRLGSNLVGHRDVGQTSCPGDNLYTQINLMRNISDGYFQLYSIQRYLDYSFVGEGVNGSPGGSVSLRNGQTATVYVDLKNEGENTWQNSGTTPVRLGTDRPQDRASAFASGWISPSRPATFTQKVVNGVPQSATSVAKGEIARFTFTVTNPNLGGSFKEYFRPVADGYAWFPRDIGLFWTINAVPDIYQSQWLDQSVNVPGSPDATATVNLTLKNTGNMTWTNTGDASTIRLGTSRNKDRSSILYDPLWLTTNRTATFAGKAQLDSNGHVVKDGGGNVQYDGTATSIAPGEAAYFTFQVHTPSALTNTREYFQPVVDGKAWLNDQGIYWPVTITFHNQFAGQSTAPVISKSANPEGVLYFDFKNTGTSTWRQDGSFPVRLGTSRATDRTSTFATFGLSGSSTPALPANSTNWINGGRPGTFAGKVSGGSLDTSATTIAPGETARFMAALDTRNVAPGTYNEYFRLVAEGLTWLEDYGTFLRVTVQP